MLKIGVVGLRPRQISDLMARSFRSEVECLEMASGTRSKQALIRFGIEHDRIIMVEKAVPTWATKIVPVNKRVLVAGSISSVAHYIENLEALELGLPEPKRAPEPIYAEEQVEKAVSDETPAATNVVTGNDVNDREEETMATSAGIQPTVTQALADIAAGVKLALAMDVPVDRDSQYRLPKGDILINYPNSGGVQDYRILRAAQPGDLVRFARPEGTNLANWRARITSMRNNYWRSEGILLEAHFYEEYVDILVMDQGEPNAPRNTLAARPLEDPMYTPRALGTTVVVESPEGIPATLVPQSELEAKGLSTPSEIPPSNEAVPSKRPEAEESASSAQEEAAYSEDEKSFWREVYLISLRQGKDHPESHAEHALALYMERFAR